MLLRESNVRNITKPSLLQSCGTQNLDASACIPDIPAGTDAIDLLVTDHESLRRLFRHSQALSKLLGVNSQKTLLVQRLCRDLTIHSEIEDQFFEPFIRSEIGRSMLPPQAIVDHAESRKLIGMIAALKSEHPDFDNAVSFLAAHVLPHMALEELELFPLLRRAKVDTVALGRQMKRAQAALQQNAVFA